MRKIKIEFWPIKTKEGEDAKESLVNILTVMIAGKKPEELPRGIDNFRLFNRLSKSFKKAETNLVLELEETDYSFLKVCLEKDLPSVWGFSEAMTKAVEDFLSAKTEE